MYTYFFDVHSGGGQKTDYAAIYIQMPKDKAVAAFTALFGDPYHVSCQCCGEDFSVREVDAIDPRVLGGDKVLVIDALGRRSVLHGVRRSRRV